MFSIKNNVFIFQPTQPHIDGATECSQNVSLNPYIQLSCQNNIQPLILSTVFEPEIY